MKQILFIKNMTCVNCEHKIISTLQKLPGVVEVKASYKKSMVSITFKEEVISLEEIISCIEALDYNVIKDEKENGATAVGNTQTVYLLLIILGVYFLLKQLHLFDIFTYTPLIENSMDLGMLFIIGLFTSIHCIGMCGGINIAQGMNRKDEVEDSLNNTGNSNKSVNCITGCSTSSCCNPSSSCKDDTSRAESSISRNLSYNIGRVISYTVIGGIVGGIGSVLTIGGMFRGIVALFAGLFMVIMGLNMLNIVPSLKRFNISMPSFLGDYIRKANKKGNSSFYIGMLNGLMPCGPLQSMQLYALSTGSMVLGATSMFFFSLGTVPLMFSFGTLFTKLNKSLKHTMVKVSSMLVLILGIHMFGNGLALSGIMIPSITSNKEQVITAMIENGVQTITTELESGSYPVIQVKEGIPVVWKIHATKNALNGCNNEIIMKEYGIKVKLVEGMNEIRFEPKSTGEYGYSCWMGMIRSSIHVV